MGFLKRISGVVSNAKLNKAKSAKKPFFGVGFNTNALKNANLKTDVFQKQAFLGNDKTIPNNISLKSPLGVSNERLAFDYPISFIEKYCNEETIDNALKTNPKIKEILAQKGLSTLYNLENVNSIKNSHLIPTSKIAQKIYVNMGLDKSSPEYAQLAQAALLHDIGKAFIPSEILNKKGRLTPKEREIVELHNKLSAEILKTTDLDPNVSKLALEHHDYEGELTKTKLNQALTIADVYCALREERPYKKPLSDLDAKAILYNMGISGKLDTRYISCIK